MVDKAYMNSAIFVKTAGILGNAFLHQNLFRSCNVLLLYQLTKRNATYKSVDTINVRLSS